MGSIFFLPISEGSVLSELPGTKVGLDAGGSDVPLPSGNLVLAVGSERSGLGDDDRAACDLLWRIPIADSVDSLNAGVAASLALHAANRISS